MKSLNNKVGFIYNDAKIQRVGKGRKMMKKSWVVYYSAWSR